MNKKKIEKEIYEAPALNKQQVILEQVIAAGSRIMESENGSIMHVWEREEVDADYDIIL
jgi:hypothetical protein